MLTQQRREKEKEQRRTLILNAAQNLFFTKNYDEITIEEIAEKAQLAKGTLYTYFKSKESLYSAVALRGAHIMNEMFKTASDRQLNGMEKAFAIGEAYYEFYKRQPHYFRMLVEAENMPIAHGDDANASELIKISCENLETVLNAVVAGIEDGSIKSDLDPNLTSIFIIQSTRAVILLPPGFEIFLKRTGADKDATIKFTLQALRLSLENTDTQKLEA